MNEPQNLKDCQISKENQITNEPQISKEPQHSIEIPNFKGRLDFQGNPNYK